MISTERDWSGRCSARSVLWNIVGMAWRHKCAMPVARSQTSHNSGKWIMGCHFPSCLKRQSGDGSDSPIFWRKCGREAWKSLRRRRLFRKSIRLAHVRGWVGEASLGVQTRLFQSIRMRDTNGAVCAISQEPWWFDTSAGCRWESQAYWNQDRVCRYRH